MTDQLTSDESKRPFTPTLSGGEYSVSVLKGKMESITVYEVADYELEQLSRGSPDALKLNLAIFFLSIAISFLVNLLTSNGTMSSKIFIIFVVAIAIGFSLGGVLLLLWWQGDSARNSLITNIKCRLKQEKSP